MLLFWAIFTSTQGQTLTGKWIGYFTPNAELSGKTYTYELEINEAPNHQLTVTTNTKFSTQSWAKANATGLYTPQTQLVSIQENKFEHVQLDQNVQACLMSNFLNYQNLRGHEILQGTYISSNLNNGKDCGGGTVFLEKSIPIVKHSAKISKAPTENITTTKLDKQKEQPKAIFTKTIVQETKKGINSSQNKPTPSLPSPTEKNLAVNTPTPNNTVKPIVVIANEQKTSETILPEDATMENTSEEASPRKQNDFKVIPWVLVGRENKLVKKLITHNKNISIDLYDNGTIDNDTIIVYDNKQLIVNKKRLSYKAIHFDLNFSNNINEHEVIIVAHNMGTVPPNTALLVYKDGMSRQELFITSTNKMNAKLIIEYEPPN
jgi:hypothetical protein